MIDRYTASVDVVLRCNNHMVQLYSGLVKYYCCIDVAVRRPLPLILGAVVANAADTVAMLRLSAHCACARARARTHNGYIGPLGRHSLDSAQWLRARASLTTNKPNVSASALVCETQHQGSEYVYVVIISVKSTAKYRLEYLIISTSITWARVVS